MALRACRECKQMISTDAAKCPHCGASNPTTQKAVISAITLVIAIIIGIWAYKNAGNIYNSIFNKSSTELSSEVIQRNRDPRFEANTERGLEVIEYHWRVGKGFESNYIVGTVRNYSNKEYKYAHVEFNLYDGSAQVGSRIANINNFEALGTWKFEIPVPEENVTDAKLKEVRGY
jgi:hypothetical protein